MKRNLILTITGAALLATTTGCLPEKAQDEDPQLLNPRDALVKAVDNQATGLINGINKVIISGNFLQNASGANPPKPIPMDSEAEIKKAVDYLLSNQTKQGDNYYYTPDPRICSEIIAKDKPQVCEKIMKTVTIVQSPTDSNSGHAALVVSGATPLALEYAEASIVASTQFSELFKALEAINLIKVQNGEQDFANELPSVHEGTLALSVTNQLATSLVVVHIMQDINIAGTNKEGQNYSIQAGTAYNVASLALYPVIGLADFSLNLPAADILFSAKDDQNVMHALEMSFPGLTASLNLDNAQSKVSVSSAMLTAPDIYVAVDGQPAFHASFPKELNVELQTSAGGNKSINILKDFSAQITISTNPLIAATGSVTAYVAKDTQVLFNDQSTQAKVLQGQVSLIGTQDFTANMDAQSNMCIEGTQNKPLFLETVVCQ